MESAGECHVPLLSRTVEPSVANARAKSRGIRPRLHEADALLEARSLLSTLMIDAIYRTTSLSPYNGTIRDPVMMGPGLSGQTTTLVGYTVATDPAIAGTTSIPFGGTGFEVDFTNTTGQDATVTVQWGGGEGAASSSFGPGTTSATFPHVYLQAGTYPVQIRLDAGGQSSTSEIRTTVSQILAEPSGIFIIGTQGDDEVSINQRRDGTVILISNLEPSDGQPVAIGKTSAVYVQALDGNDIIQATPRFRASLHVDAGRATTRFMAARGTMSSKAAPGTTPSSAGRAMTHFTAVGQRHPAGRQGHQRTLRRLGGRPARRRPRVGSTLRRRG